MGLKLITPPATEPVTLTEVKSQLRIDSVTEDTYLGTLITAAREYCEMFQNRAYITQTWEFTLDTWPRFPFKLPMPPLVSVTFIHYHDTADVETIWAASNYFVDTDSEPGRVGLRYNIVLPTTTLRSLNAIKIQYMAGYGAAAAVPLRTKQAILLLVGHLYENRETVSPVDLKEIPFAVSALLWTDRLVPI